MVKEKKESAANVYNIWSNFMYFIAGLYAIFVAILCDFPNADRGLFSIIGIFIIITGIVSIMHHLNTPSWTKKKKNENHELMSEIDTCFSITLFVVGLVFFLKRLYFIRSNMMPLIKDPVLYLVILFGIMSLVFFIIANEKNEKANTGCYSENLSKSKTKECVKDNHEEYDIYHSNWHLFTGIFALFGITLLKNTFFYNN